MIKYFKKEANAAWDRFRHFVWPPGIWQYRHSQYKARVPRYPAPGSEPVDREFTYIDYKTAYRESTHNIRYHVNLHPHTAKHKYIADPLTETPEEKLIRYGFLTKDNKGDAAAVADAKKKYQELMEEPVEVTLHQDDFGIAGKVKSRESIAEYIANQFDAISTHNRNTEHWLNDLDEVYRPQIYHLKSLDLAADDPVYRQLVIDLEYQINEYVEQRLQMKGTPVFKGSADYWHVLDSSFSEENRKKIQATIKTYVASISDTAPAIQEEGKRNKLKDSHHRFDTIPTLAETKYQ
jgi:hypothetical protein